MELTPEQQKMLDAATSDQSRAALYRLFARAYAVKFKKFSDTD